MILAPHTRSLRAILTAAVQIRDVEDADRPTHLVSLHDGTRSLDLIANLAPRSPTMPSHGAVTPTHGAVTPSIDA
jgi:hypothetical protein